jgi:hypothetical protein
MYVTLQPSEIIGYRQNSYYLEKYEGRLEHEKKNIHLQLYSTNIDLCQYMVKVQQNLITGQNVLIIPIQNKLQCSHHFTDKQLIVYLNILIKVIQPPFKTAAFQYKITQFTTQNTPL